MEREIEHLKEKGTQIAQDIYRFLNERDKHKWRGWEEESDPRILAIIRANYNFIAHEKAEEPTDQELDELTLKLINQVNFIEDKLEMVERDKRIYDLINKSMKVDVSRALKHTQWLKSEHKRDLNRSSIKSSRRATYDSGVSAGHAVSHGAS